MSTGALTLDDVVVRASELVDIKIEEGQIILSVQNGRYYGMTDIGQRIWQLITSPISIRAICDTLLEEYDIVRPTCESQVLKFVQELSKENIIEIRNDAP
jgi:hypothetical protein